MQALFLVTEGGTSNNTGGGGGGGCFIGSAMYGSPASRQASPDRGVAAILIGFGSMLIISMGLFYLFRRLLLHGVLFKVSRVKRT
jgi:hypothetical protein